MQPERLSLRVGVGLSYAEDAAALRMQRPLLYKGVDVLACREEGIQLQERLKAALLQFPTLFMERLSEPLPSLDLFVCPIQNSLAFSENFQEY